jgi:hypothetical protein
MPDGVADGSTREPRVQEPDCLPKNWPNSFRFGPAYTRKSGLAPGDGAPPAEECDPNRRRLATLRHATSRTVMSNGRFDRGADNRDAALR